MRPRASGGRLGEEAAHGRANAVDSRSSVIGDDVQLKKEWSSDRTWYRYADPRPVHVRSASGSKTVGGRWFYGPDDNLEIRWEDAPRGWAVWFREQRVGFSADITPEPAIGDSIRAAKRRAVELLAKVKGAGGFDPIP